jgi:hypothetical protein
MEDENHEQNIKINVLVSKINKINEINIHLKEENQKLNILLEKLGNRILSLEEKIK